MAHGKQKFKIRDACKKGGHEWYVSHWMIKGAHKDATEFYCKYCLLTCDSIEKQHQSKECLKEQVDLPQPQGT